MNIWNDILGHVREHVCPQAVIAGGAVRDFLLNRTPKDIDVFVNVQKSEWLNNRTKRLPTDIFAFAMMDHEEYEDWTSGVVGVMDGSINTPFHYARVQIIARPMENFSGEALVSRFDFNICKSWYDVEIHDTPEALEDRLNGTMTLALWDTPEQVDASYRRWERKRHLYKLNLTQEAIAALGNEHKMVKAYRRQDVGPKGNWVTIDSGTIPSVTFETTAGNYITYPYIGQVNVFDR